MNIAPIMNFIGCLIIFGVLLALFQPFVTYIQELFPVTIGVAYYGVMLTLWLAAPGFVLVRSFIKMIMQYQRLGKISA